MEALRQLDAAAARFEWSTETLPLAQPRWLAIAPAAYVAAVLLLRAALPRRPLPLGPVPALHNLVLVVSAAMFVGVAAEATALTRRQGSALWLFCLPPGTRAAGSLYFWSYLYYLSKYYELLDTVLRVLKAQPLEFLHVFHHAVVIVMAWLWLEHVQSLQVIALLTNTGVHVVMYSYYFLCSVGVKPSWKKAVTNGQLVQFVFSFLCCVPFVALHATRGCAGAAALAFNGAFNLALLFLFADFHRRSYGRGAGRRQVGGVAAAPAQQRERKPPASPERARSPAAQRPARRASAAQPTAAGPIRARSPSKRVRRPRQLD